MNKYKAEASFTRKSTSETIGRVFSDIIEAANETEAHDIAESGLVMVNSGRGYDFEFFAYCCDAQISISEVAYD